MKSPIRKGFRMKSRVLLRSPIGKGSGMKSIGKGSRLKNTAGKGSRMKTTIGNDSK